MNKFIKISYASSVQWRYTMASHLDERNVRISNGWGDSLFEHVFKLWSDNVSWKSCIFKPTGSKESLEQNLINELLRGYNKDAHPIPVQNKSLYLVTFGLELVQLVNVVSSITVKVFILGLLI